MPDRVARVPHHKVPLTVLHDLDLLAGRGLHVEVVEVDGRSVTLRVDANVLSHFAATVGRHAEQLPGSVVTA